MITKIRQTLCLFHVIVSLIPTNGNAIRHIDSDSRDYEEHYEELDAEYAANLYKSTTEKTPEIPLEGTDAEWAKQYDEIVQPVQENKHPETYAETTSRLQCDNPWFWNTFKCSWLDIRHKNITGRTRKNFKVAGIITGILSFLIMIPICWICIISIYLRYQVKKYAKMMDRFITEYAPGSIILPNGEVKYYNPTPEEEDAFDDLIHEISSVV